MNLIIERVSNGWVVRPFDPFHDGRVVTSCRVSVFRTVEELQKELPVLLRPADVEEKEKPARTFTGGITGVLGAVGSSCGGA